MKAGSMKNGSWLAGVALAFLAGVPAGAQPVPDEFRFEVGAAPVLAGAQLPDVAFFDVVAGFGGEVVTGAPYSAEAETEFVQTLADGNRIVRRSTTTVHRDGQGRTRRELGLALLGPLASGDEAPRRVVIDDPVAGVSWVLDPEAHTARRHPRLAVEWTPEGNATAPVRPPGAAMMWTRKTGTEGPDGAGLEHVGIEAAPAIPGPRFGTFVAEPVSEGDVREEPLGARDFSGVAAEGQRRVVSIPAGRIGNEKAIEIVSERWYSEELHTVVESVRRDPRVGETSFRLKDLRLGEPDPALFEVPAGWKVEEGTGPDTIIIHEREDEP